jgi:hypothetical protein
MSPETWENPVQLRITRFGRGSDVVTCGSKVTGFFTMCESQSRLTVSLLKHTEGLDVFA